MMRMVHNVYGLYTCCLRARCIGCWLLVLTHWQLGHSAPVNVSDPVLDAESMMPVPVQELNPEEPVVSPAKPGAAKFGLRRPATCTGPDRDPWETGRLVPCCDGLDKCLGEHGGGGSPPSYRCVTSCLCTTEDKDPWMTGVQQACCSDLQQCLGRHKTDRQPFYKCLQACPKLAGSGWCVGEEPEAGFDLRRTCGNGTDMKVLTYNLFWWNLFTQHGGRGGSAGRLIARNGQFDVMAFQECEDAWRVLRDGGVSGSYDIVAGPGATAMAFDNSTWELLEKGESWIAEDQWTQYFGKRAVQWVRLQHLTNNKTVFAANHHGPLPVNTGGQCGGPATAYNLLSVIRANAQEDDVKLLLGDFNADDRSSTQRVLKHYMHRIAHYWVDAIFSSCPYRRAWRLGTGGSDHEAIEAHFEI